MKPIKHLIQKKIEKRYSRKEQKKEYLIVNVTQEDIKESISEFNAEAQYIHTITRECEIACLNPIVLSLEKQYGTDTFLFRIWEGTDQKWKLIRWNYTSVYEEYKRSDGTKFKIYDTDNSSIKLYDLSENANQFMIDFEKGKKLKPFQFQVEGGIDVCES